MSAFRLALIVSMLVAGCGKGEKPKPLSPDELMRGKMIGTWVQGTNNNPALRFLADGSFKEAATNHSHVPPASWIYEGDWSVSKGELISTVTKAVPINSTYIGEVGIVYIGRIIRVDKTNLVVEFEGQTNIWKRKD